MTATRYYALDGIRGLALLNMITYHAVWDLVYLSISICNGINQKALISGSNVSAWTFIFLPVSANHWERKK